MRVISTAWHDDSLAASGSYYDYKSTNVLLMANLLCSESAARSVSAMFNQRRDSSVALQCSDPRAGGMLVRDNQHYQIESHKLGPGLVHLRLISKRPQFIPWRTLKCIYMALKGGFYNTPLLYSWTEHIASRLQRDKLMISPSQWQCDTSLLLCGPSQLDKAVSSLIVSGSLQFKE